MNVLIVEDNKWQREEMARLLQTADTTIIQAAHVLDAIEVIDEQIPDVIVLDMMLPGPNGMTLLHELRTHTDLAQIPVVVCSSHELQLSELRPYGVVAVLAKASMTPQQIVASIQGAVA